MTQPRSRWVCRCHGYISRERRSGGKGLRSGRGALGSDGRSGGGTCIGGVSGMESDEASGEASDGGGATSGDRAAGQGTGRGDAPRDGRPEYFLHCAIGPASCRVNAGGCGGVGWNGCDGLRFLWHPSGTAFPQRLSLSVFLCWSSWWGSGGGVWNGVACQRRCGGSAPACFGMVGEVLVSCLCLTGQCLRAARSLPQRFVTLRLARLCCRCCRRLQHNLTYRRGERIKLASRLFQNSRFHIDHAAPVRHEAETVSMEASLMLMPAKMACW